MDLVYNTNICSFFIEQNIYSADHATIISILTTYNAHHTNTKTHKQTQKHTHTYIYINVHMNTHTKSLVTNTHNYTKHVKYSLKKVKIN